MEKNSSILVVDDDKSTRKSLSFIFSKNGYETETVGTGREAIKKAKERFFNVSLLDIKLPDMEGVELIRPLKEMHPDMEVIMVTGYASMDTAVQALNDRASAYIVKPIDMDEILATLRELLEKQRLELENRRLFQMAQKELAERKRVEKQLSASLDEKEVLMKEIHHRIKNNMQIIYSMLNLQSAHIKDKKALKMLKQCQNRVRSMALLHEELYRSEDLSRIKFGDYIRKLVSSLFFSYGIKHDCIKPKIDIKDVFLNINTAIPCGLIINELVSNSLKHAFLKKKALGRKGSSKGEILIKLSSNKKNKFTLNISDNGIGFPENFDFRNTKSLGLKIVSTLVGQLNGNIRLRGKDGASFEIEFPG